MVHFIVTLSSHYREMACMYIRPIIIVNVGKNAKQTPGNAEETVNIVTATDLNHLNDWIIQERITVMLLRDAKQRCGCL